MIYFLVIVLVDILVARYLFDFACRWYELQEKGW